MASPPSRPPKSGPSGPIEALGAPRTPLGAHEAPGSLGRPGAPGPLGALRGLWVGVGGRAFAPCPAPVAFGGPWASRCNFFVLKEKGKTVKASVRKDTDLEPVTFYAHHETLLEELLHQVGGKGHLRAVLDLTPTEPTMAFLCVKWHLPFLGVCFNDMHRSRLKLRLSQMIFKAFLTSGSPLYKSEASVLMKISQSNEFPAKPKAKGKPKAKAKGQPEEAPEEADDGDADPEEEGKKPEETEATKGKEETTSESKPKNSAEGGRAGCYSQGKGLESARGPPGAFPGGPARPGRPQPGDPGSPDA